jgi:putative DNA primase/helicase
MQEDDSAADIVQDDDPLLAGAFLLPPPTEPMKVARILAAQDYEEGGVTTLHRWRGGWMMWERARWVEREEAWLRARLYTQLEHAVYIADNEMKPWAPNKSKITNVLQALEAITYLSNKTDPPAWTGLKSLPDGEVISCTNGLLHVASRTLSGHDPNFFNQGSVPFGYDASATAPRWLQFLDQLWPGDQTAINALQEWFGYVLSGRTDLHKILLMIGPPRAGKGVIARVLTALVGRQNVAGPTLASLGTNFGLSPLLDKTLAIIADARLGGGNDQQIVERLLSISGEDMLTVDRKYQAHWIGTLLVRFMIISNELPRFGDASGAVTNRFVTLSLANTWLGKENTNLTNELLQELPGILQWSLDGLDRLRRNGKFSEPTSSTDAILTLRDLNSPISAFVRERCVIGPNYEVAPSDLFDAWKVWCDEAGEKVGTIQLFGRSLRAAFPRVSMVHGGAGRRYGGIGLR